MSTVNWCSSYVIKPHSSSKRWMTVNVADCLRKTVAYTGTTSGEGKFTKLGPCPFHDCSSGLSWRRWEFAVLNATRSARYDRHRLRKTGCINVAILKMMRYSVTAGVMWERRSSSGILYSLQRRQGRCRKAGEYGVTVVKARNDEWCNEWHNNWIRRSLLSW